MLLTQINKNNNSTFEVSKRGQTLAEVSIILVLVVMVFAGMQTYMQRGLQARNKTAVDASVSLVQQAANQSREGVEELMQYEPYYLRRQTQQTIQSAQRESFSENGGKRALQNKDYSVESRQDFTVLGRDFELEEEWLINGDEN